MTTLLSIMSYLATIADRMGHSVAHTATNIVHPTMITATLLTALAAWIYFGALYVISARKVQS